MTMNKTNYLEDLYLLSTENSGVDSNNFGSKMLLMRFILSTLIICIDELTCDLAKALVEKLLRYDNVVTTETNSLKFRTVLRKVCTNIFESSWILTKSSSFYGVQIIFRLLKDHCLHCSDGEAAGHGKLVSACINTVKRILSTQMSVSIESQYLILCSSISSNLETSDMFKYFL